MRILVIEDETKVAKAIRRGLEAEGCEVVLAPDGEDGYARAAAGEFDLVLLDLMLPRRSGLEVLTALRKKGNQIPILILTAKDEVEDRVYGLDAGADDYLVKPFAFAELLARIRALSRRGRPTAASRMSIADLVIDADTRSIHRAANPIQLTAKEFDLLSYLAHHEGHIVSREMIARDVWNEPVRATPLDNVIDVHIARLRKKVDEGFAPALIHTVRGVGFVVRVEP